MKEHVTRFAAAFAALVLCISCLAGCGSSIGGDAKDETAVILEGEKYSLEETKLYIYASQYSVEKNSEWMILYLYGSYDYFWSMEQDGQSYYKLNYNQGISQLLQTKRLLKKAASEGIALSAEDLEKVEMTIASFKDTYGKVVEAAGYSDEMIRKFVTDNALAVKVYLSMVADVDTNFDYDTFRRKSVKGVYVSALTEKPAAKEETEEDAEAEENAEEETKEAETVTYTEEEQKAAREEAAAAILKRIQDGDDPADIVADYENSETVTVYSAGDLQLSPDDAAEEGADITTYRQYAWTLSTGEIGTFDVESTSKVTTYILKCENDDDPDLRKTAEDSELATRKSNLFAEGYTALRDKYDNYHVYDTVVSRIKEVIPLYDSELLKQAQEAAE